MSDPEPKRSRADRQQEVRGRVLDTAYRLFARNGFASTTMDDIAAASGVPRRTLFRHFGSKEQVALAYQDTILDELVERLKARPPGGDALTALTETIAGYVGELRHDQALELSDLLVRNADLRAYNLQKYAAIEAALAKIVEPYCSASDRALEARVLAASVIATWRIANDRWLASDRAQHPIVETIAAFSLLQSHDRTRPG